MCTITVVVTGRGIGRSENKRGSKEEAFVSFSGLLAEGRASTDHKYSKPLLFVFADSRVINTLSERMTISAGK